MLIQNAKDNYVIITDYTLNYIFIYASKIYSNVSEKKVKLIIDYAKEINTILIVDHPLSKLSPFANAVHRNNFNVVQLLMDYNKENKIILNINKINHYTNNPLFQNKNILMSKLLMEYAIENRIVLDINLKNYHKRCSLSSLFKNDNIEMVHFLMQYAKKIILY